MVKKPTKVKYQLKMVVYQRRILGDLAGRTGRAPGAVCGDIVEAFRDYFLEVKREYGLRFIVKHDGAILQMTLMKLAGRVDDTQFHQFMTGLRPKDKEG